MVTGDFDTWTLCSGHSTAQPGCCPEQCSAGRTFPSFTNFSWHSPSPCELPEQPPSWPGAQLLLHSKHCSQNHHIFPELDPPTPFIHVSYFPSLLGPGSFPWHSCALYTSLSGAKPFTSPPQAPWSAASVPPCSHLTFPCFSSLTPLFTWHWHSFSKHILPFPPKLLLWYKAFRLCCHPSSHSRKGSHTCSMEVLHKSTAELSLGLWDVGGLLLVFGSWSLISKWPLIKK